MGMIGDGERVQVWSEIGQRWCRGTVVSHHNNFPIWRKAHPPITSSLEVLLDGDTRPSTFTLGVNRIERLNACDQIAESL